MYAGCTPTSIYTPKSVDKYLHIVLTHEYDDEYDYDEEDDVSHEGHEEDELGSCSSRRTVTSLQDSKRPSPGRAFQSTDALHSPAASGSSRTQGRRGSLCLVCVARKTTWTL